MTSVAVTIIFILAYVEHAHSDYQTKSFCSKSRNNAMFARNNGRKLYVASSEILYTAKVKQFESCLGKCRYHTDCLAINVRYEGTSFLCELLSVDRGELEESSFKDFQNGIYFEYETCDPIPTPDPESDQP